MNLEVTIGERHEYELKKVLLYYGKSSNQWGGFLTEHKLVMSAEGPEIGPGVPLTLSKFNNIMQSLSGAAEIDFLPDHVLGHGSNAFAWWTPACKRAMFFVGGQDELALSGGVFPQPALLWIVKHGCLAVRALAENRRPDASDPVYVAPYWNTNPYGGSVCTGSMVRPRQTTANNLHMWEDGFFSSKFTHPSGSGVLTSHPDGFLGLWKELKDQETFPAKYLRACKHTALRFMKGSEGEE